MLLGLLKDPSDAIAQAAIKGLAQLGTPEAVTSLTQLLNDPLRSGAVRSEAATGLGTGLLGFTVTLDVGGDGFAFVGGFATFLGAAAL